LQVVVADQIHVAAACFTLGEDRKAAQDAPEDIRGFRKHAASFLLAVGALFGFDVLIDPGEDQIRELEIIAVLHEHVAIALDAHFR
jgi:hypothetical protein